MYQESRIFQKWPFRMKIRKMGSFTEPFLVLLTFGPLLEDSVRIRKNRVEEPKDGSIITKTTAVSFFSNWLRFSEPTVFCVLLTVEFFSRHPKHQRSCNWVSRKTPGYVVKSHTPKIFGGFSSLRRAKI